MEKLCKDMNNKLYKMWTYLKDLSCKFEMIADEIDHVNLKNTLQAASIETYQYAKELNDVITIHALVPALPDIHELEEVITKKHLLDLSKEKGKELLSIIESCESFFTQLYTELLAEYLTDKLKHMIYCQFLGIKFAFMRMRFLNDTRFDHSLTPKEIYEPVY